MTPRLRSGFTLVELLVVIAIIGVLVSLLLPAVNSARESARGLSCKNNLKNAAQAVVTYATQRKELPPAGLMDNPSTTYFEPQNSRYSWITQILPQLEQEPLYNQFDFTQASVSNEALNPQAVSLEILNCPSDAASGRVFQHSLTGNRPYAKGNIAAFTGPFHVENAPAYPGVIAPGRVVTDATVSQGGGSSNTLMLSEVLTRPNTSDQRGAWALPWTGSSLISFDMHGSLTPFQGYSYSIGQTQPPNSQGPNVDMLYACTEVADAQVRKMPCATWQSSGGWRYLSAAPRSHHPGGVNVAFADGHIGFLSDNVDDYAMAYMISITDRQVVSIGDFVR